MNSVKDLVLVARTGTHVEPHSPELVLVDPEFGALARARLPVPPDTLAERRWVVADGASGRLSIGNGVHTGTAIRSRPRARVIGGRPWFRVVLVVAGLLGAALGVIQAGSGRSTSNLSAVAPASLGTPAVEADEQPVGKVAGRLAAGSSSRSGQRARPTLRRFAWAPVEKASGYRFELFRGQSLILGRETTIAELAVPVKWHFGGKSFALEPGVYRWYVWPIVDGRRSAAAVVQAELVVRS